MNGNVPRKIYPVFLPNLGCRSRCVFCNQARMTGQKARAPEEIEETEIPEVDEIAFYGGTFTWLPKDLIHRYLSIRPNIPKRISTRPDAIDDRIVEILETHNVQTIELGIESLDDGVLTKANRGYDTPTALLAVRKLAQRFDLVVHLMFGLPGTSREKDLSSVIVLLKAGVRQFRLHPTIVFAGTALEVEYHKGTYSPLELKDAVDLTADAVVLVEAHGGSVLRIGYHVPESQKRYVVAGPYHPSFGDMVRTKIVRKVIEHYNVRRASFSRRYAPWFYAFGNAELKVERNVVDEEEMRFDERTYEELIRDLGEKIQKEIQNTEDCRKLLFMLESLAN